MKKIFKTIVTIALCALATFLFPRAVRADSMVVSGGDTYGVGDTVTISIQFYGDTEIYAFEGTISYDTSVLSGDTRFLGDGDGSNYACTTVYLTVVGYGETSVDVTGTYSEGENMYPVSDSTYVSVPTPAPEEPQTGEVVIDPTEEEYDDDYDDYDNFGGADDYVDDDYYDQPEENWNIEETGEVLQEVVQIETTTVDDKGNLQTEVDGKKMQVVDAFTITEYIDEKSTQVSNPLLANLPTLNGFTLTTTEYNGEKVDIYQVKDVIDVYVLADDSLATDYYTYDSETKCFRKLVYGVYNSRTFVLLDIPDDVTLSNYEKKELTICNGKVTAFQAKTEANDNENSLANASPEDFYIVYAIVDGSQGYYSYDQKDSTMQRLNSGYVDGLVKEKVTIEPVEEETKAASGNSESGFGSLPKGFKLLILLLIVIIIALAATIIILFIRKEKHPDKNDKEIEMPQKTETPLADEDYSPMDIDYNGQEPQTIETTEATDKKENDNGGNNG